MLPLRKYPDSRVAHKIDRAAASLRRAVEEQTLVSWLLPKELNVQAALATDETRLLMTNDVARHLYANIMRLLMPQAENKITSPKNDGTYAVEFKTATGQLLAISVPAGEKTLCSSISKHGCLTAWSCLRSRCHRLTAAGCPTPLPVYKTSKKY
jgi:hypothetical protein